MTDIPTTKDKQRRHMDDLIKLQRLGLGTTPLESGRRYFDEVLDGLRLLRQQMANRTEGGRGRTSADPVTPTKIAEVQRLRQDYPTLSQQEIASRANLNVGRVSEILHGKRQ